MKIKAAVARVHGAPLAIEGVDLGDPAADEVLVRLIAAGVARPDRDAVAGDIAMPLPFVPGSEGAGIVERVGDEVSSLAVGDAVVIGYASCGLCEPCRADNPRACIDFAALNLAGRRLDGSSNLAAGEGSDGKPINGFFFGQSAFGTHVVCTERSAIGLGPGAPLEILAALGGELLNGAAAIIQGFDLQAGDTVVIAGADASGLVATMVAKARGAGTIIVADPDEARRKLATDCGATVAAPTEDKLVDIVRSMTGAGARFALDTTGHAATIEACVASLAPGGVCAIVDPVWGDQATLRALSRELAATIVSADATLSPRRLVPELAALQAEGKLPIERFINFFPFELVNDALAASNAGEVLKAVLRFPLGAFGDLDRAGAEGAAREMPDADPQPEPVEEPARPPAEAPVTA